MQDGTDWVWRPVLRRMCSLESYFNGTLDLAIIAQLNEAIDVLDENERRAMAASRA